MSNYPAGFPFPDLSAFALDAMIALASMFLCAVSLWIYAAWRRSKS